MDGYEDGWMDEGVQSRRWEGALGVEARETVPRCELEGCAQGPRSASFLRRTGSSRVAKLP